MKPTIIKTKDAGIVIGIDHDGRIERVFVAADQQSEDQSTASALAHRMVNAHRACTGISDSTLIAMADGASESGTLPERIVAWQLFVSRARGSARLIMEEARRIIAKEGGKL